MGQPSMQPSTDPLTLCTPAERRRAVLRVYRDRAAIGLDPMAKGVVAVLEHAEIQRLHTLEWLADAQHHYEDCTYPGDTCKCGLEELLKELEWQS